MVLVSSSMSCFIDVLIFLDLVSIDKLWAEMRTDVPKPRLTFIIVSKRWVLVPFLAIFEL